MSKQLQYNSSSKRWKKPSITKTMENGTKKKWRVPLQYFWTSFCRPSTAPNGIHRDILTGTGIYSKQMHSLTLGFLKFSLPSKITTEMNKLPSLILNIFTEFSTKKYFTVQWGRHLLLKYKFLFALNSVKVWLNYTWHPLVSKRDWCNFCKKEVSNLEGGQCNFSLYYYVTLISFSCQFCNYYITWTTTLHV